MLISDWSSDVCSSDLSHCPLFQTYRRLSFRAASYSLENRRIRSASGALSVTSLTPCPPAQTSFQALIVSSSRARSRSEEHTSELQSLMRISYAVFCLKKKNKKLIISHLLHSLH